MTQQVPLYISDSCLTLTPNSVWFDKMSNPIPDIATPTPNATACLPNGALQKVAQKALYKTAINKVLNTFLSNV